MLQILAVTETFVTFFLVLTTVSLAHRKQQPRLKFVQLLFFILLFSLIYAGTDYLIMRFHMPYLLHYLMIFLPGICFFAILFPACRVSCIILFISHTLCLRAVRGSFSVVTDYLFPGRFDADVRQYLFFVFFYLFAILLSFWFLQHPPEYVSELPGRITCCMFAFPLIMFLFSEIYINLAYTNQTLYTMSLCFFFLLFLTAALIYYLFYTITETYHKKYSPN